MQTSILFKVPGKPSTSPILFRCFSLLFSAQVSTAVLVAAALLVWWHIATAPGTLAAQRAAGIDALLLAPWLAAWAMRSLTSAKEGGAK